MEIENFETTFEPKKIVDEEEKENFKGIYEFEIEKILDRKFDENEKCYLCKVKWKGFDDEDNTWESENYIKELYTIK